MEREYYILWYRLKNQERYLLWYSNDDDGVWLDYTGKIPTSSTIHVLQRYAKEQGIPTIKNETPILHNLDAVRQWLLQETKTSIDCQEFLAAWNLFCDVATSLDIVIQELQATCGDALTVYNKLFYGNNLPAITPPGKHYDPKWDDEEITILQRVMNMGLKILQQNSSALEERHND